MLGGLGAFTNQATPMVSTHAHDRPTRSHESNRRKSSGEFQLKNSRVVLEYGPAGAVARVERPNTTDYVGPLSPATIGALKQVAGGEASG